MAENLVLLVRIVDEESKLRQRPLQLDAPADPLHAKEKEVAVEVENAKEKDCPEDASGHRAGTAHEVMNFPGDGVRLFRLG